MTDTKPIDEPRLKPLAWREELSWCEQPVWVADTPFGTARISETAEKGRYCWDFKEALSNNPTHVMQKGVTVKQTMIAVWNHYVAHMRPALADTPGPVLADVEMFVEQLNIEHMYNTDELNPDALLTGRQHPDGLLELRVRRDVAKNIEFNSKLRVVVFEVRDESEENNAG